MAIAEEAALLEDDVSSAVDHRGFPAGKSTTGGWRSALFIIGVEVAERFAYFGISSNLISYLTGPLGQSTAAAAANVDAWSGTASVLPILGAFVADAYLGRYLTILVSSLIYLLGLGLLTLSAVLILTNMSEDKNVVSSSSSLVNVLFFCSLYLVAIGQGGHKPCVQAFGADQFDVDDPREKIARASFFNWWFLSLSFGITLAIVVVVYVQDYVNWALGFGIPFVFMVVALVLFLLGSRTYRYSRKHEEGNAFTRIGRVFFVAFKNRRLQEDQTEPGFLKKALLAPTTDEEEGAKPCNARDVEDATALARLIPIWLTTLVCDIPFAQYATFFTKQGLTMNRKILPNNIEIPPASLQMLIGVSIVLVVPIYDRLFVPLARSITKQPSGITTLQRIGAGMVLSVFTMLVAALVEIKRLETARMQGLVDRPDETVPMSVLWLVPQYGLVGVGNVLTLVGTQEFFYDQVPRELRSAGLAMCLSALGIGSFVSSVMISVIDWVSGGRGESWFDNNLNKAHLDYFYLLLAFLTSLGFLAFLFISKSYVYRR